MSGEVRAEEQGSARVTVIAVVSTKRGCGISTLAECLAVHAVKLGLLVHLADLDMQQSSAEWWRRRGGPDNPMLVASRGMMVRRLKEIRQLAGERGAMIIDVPSSEMTMVEEAMRMADVVVIVVRPSLKDLEAQGAMRDLINMTQKADRSLYVINQVDGRSTLGPHAVAVIRDRSPHEPVLITKRTAYIRADAVGKVGNEVSKQARGEILSLWKP